MIGALGLQLTDYDVDLETLWKTGSVQESRVELKDGLKIIGSSCQSNNLNCADFSTQQEAQTKYEMCAEKIATDNKTETTAVRNLDIYGLDKDKDGIVCEALQRGAATTQ